MAATSFVAGLLQAANGFGFAVLAVPLFLLFVEPGPAVQLVVIVTLALSAVFCPGWDTRWMGRYCCASGSAASPGCRSASLPSGMPTQLPSAP